MRWLIRHAVKGLLYAVLTILLSMHITFILVNNMPGDPVERIARELMWMHGYTYEQAYKIASVTYALAAGNKTLAEKYFEYLNMLLRLNLGYSFTYGTSVNRVIVESLPWTLLVGIPGIIIGFTLGAFLGSFSALQRKKLPDTILITAFTVIDSTPSFLIALLLIFVFAVGLGVLPAQGATEPGVSPGFTLEYIGGVARRVILPVLSYAIPAAAGWYFTMRSVAVSSLGEDFVLFAQARGVEERRIVKTYVMRSGLLPMVAGLAIAFGLIVGGSLLIETIFAYPGMGYHFVVGFNNHDYGLLQGLFLAQAITLSLANLVADIVYPILDPRVRYL
ncbi:MAG: ABC transporter permease [Thermofilaceae archaeon]